MKKFIKRMFGILVLLAIAGLVAGFFFLNSIVKKGVETVGPKIAKVNVRLGSAQISPFNGSGRLKEFFLGNPEGYKTPSAIQVGDVNVDVAMSSLMSDVIVVEEINVQAPEITFEGGLGGSNLKQILDNLSSSSEKEETQPSEPTTKAEARKFFVKDFVIKGAKVNVNLTGLGGKTVVVPLPDIHLQNIGTKDKGATIAEISKVAMNALLASVTDVVQRVATDVGKGAVYIGKEAGDGVNKVTKGLKGLFQSGSKTNE